MKFLDYVNNSTAEERLYAMQLEKTHNQLLYFLLHFNGSENKHNGSFYYNILNEIHFLMNCNVYQQKRLSQLV
jgi:hypothetical protein